MPNKSSFDRNGLTALFSRQHGVVSRRQALELGMTVKAVKYRIRPGGCWQAILPGIYLDHTGTATAQQREMAALLYGGPCSVLTGAAALRRFGLTTARTAVSASVDVLVPCTTQRRDRGFVRLHRTSRLPSLVCVAGPISYVLPPRAVADAARSLERLSDVRAVVADAVQQGKCLIPRLAEELAEGPVWNSAHLRRAVAEVADGIRSTAEADVYDLIRSARLPKPLLNHRLFAGRVFLGVPDCWWPGYGLAAEIDSRAWHLSPRGWEETLAKHARMSAYGIVVLHFTPVQIRDQPGFVVAAIRNAINNGRPRPDIRALPPA